MDSFYTILSEEDDKISQPETIKIPLMNHQKTMISKMIDIETNGKIIKKDIVNLHRMSLSSFTGKIKSSEINTNIGILGDKVGAGKTLMIISLISQNKELKDRDLEIGGNAFYWVEKHNIAHHSFTNIDGADEDIDIYPFMRLNNNQKKYNTRLYGNGLRKQRVSIS
jgi:hypothetical protein